MIKKIGLIGCVGLLTAMGSITAQAQTPTYQIAARYPRLRGTVVSVAMGHDSFGLKIKSRGRIYEFMHGPSTDGNPKEYANGPSQYPAIIDIGSTVEVTYYEDFYFLDYRVLARPRHLWITIADSQPITDSKPPEFWNLKTRWEESSGSATRTRGVCWADTLASSAYRALKPGYWILAAGGFTTLAEAEACRKQAVALGKKEAYIRKLW
jgi:hypothetical protein